MIHKLTIAAIALSPASALAHTSGHGEMSLMSELSHMLSEPMHIALIGAVVAAAALIKVSLGAKTASKCED